MPGSEPVSQSIRPAFRCVDEVVGELLEAELGGPDQVADEGSGFLRMLLSAAPVFLM